ncbi:uncharacterized protein K02A2.6-like [Macrobrachium nipponense]|uniref:uncharacterized protein K02A2.6-like n=1 Tax=Macrobrachium nipponense TaxID=159736 RepID=UPI0030C7F1D9
MALALNKLSSLPSPNNREPMLDISRFVDSELKNMSDIQQKLAKKLICNVLHMAAIPKHWEEEVKAQLDEDVWKGVIDPVLVGDATEWCARMVVVAKKTGQPRCTVDFQRINAHCLRYAPVDGEALAVTWCLRKARLFLLGCPNLTIITDHRPLVKLLGDRALEDIINPRLFNLKEKTLQFKFHIKYLPGKRNTAVDFLSRYPTVRAPHEASDVELEDDIQVAVAYATVAALEPDIIELDEDYVRSAASNNSVYQLLLARVAAGDWPQQKSQEISCLRPFFGVRDRLAINQDLVTYSVDQGCIRLVIPEDLRHQVATNLHTGHQGLDSLLRRAKQSVYWPGIEGDLQHRRAQCTSCNEHAPSLPPEEMIHTPPAEYPFQQVVADMFQIEGNVYMVTDRLTGWLEVAHFPCGATSNKISNHLRSDFSRWGAPEQISTDGGTNLASEEMVAFFRRWGVKVRLSSAQYPQSNGRAEAAVKSAKRLLRENTSKGGALESDKMALAILQYLNRPLREISKSPSQLAMSRQLRDGVPTARRHLLVDRYWRRTIRQRELQVAKSQEAMRTLDTTRRLPPIKLGTHVRIENQATKQKLSPIVSTQSSSTGAADSQKGTDDT